MRKKFYVIPEAKRVIAKMSRKGAMDYNDFSQIDYIHQDVLASSMDYDGVVGDLGSACSLKATAVCDPRDEFDERIGREIASSKLELKNHMLQARAYDKAYRLLIETANMAANLCKKHFNKAEAIREDLQRMYGSKDDE